MSALCLSSILANQMHSSHKQQPLKCLSNLPPHAMPSSGQSQGAGPCANSKLVTLPAAGQPQYAAFQRLLDLHNCCISKYSEIIVLSTNAFVLFSPPNTSTKNRRLIFRPAIPSCKSVVTALPTPLTPGSVASSSSLSMSLFTAQLHPGRALGFFSKQNLT